jgi:hypothetical protein
LTYDSTSEEQRRTLAAVRVYLRDLPVELVVETSERKRDLADRLAESGELATSHQAVGTFAIEPSRDGSTLVFFTEAGGEATLVRRFPPSRQSTSVAAEQAAIVVRSLVTALVEGGRLGVVPDTAREEPGKPERQAPHTAPEAPLPLEPARVTSREVGSTKSEALPSTVAPATHGSFFVAVGLVVTVPGGGLPLQPGASVGLRWFAASTLYAGARYTFNPTAELDAGSARISVARRPAELLLGYERRASPGLNGELSLLLEQVQRRTLESDEGFEPTPATTHWNLAVGPRIGVTLAPSPVLRLTLRAGADFLLKRAEYSTDEAVLLDPSAVRPRLELEAGFGLW